jgi:outer membrane protein TolC
MKVFSVSLRRALLIVASGLILAFTTFSFPAMAQGNVGDGLPPLPKSPIERAQQDGTALPLSLTELTKLALQNNLDIAIQDTNEELNRQRLIGTYGAYDPTLSAVVSTSSDRRISTSAFDTAAAGTTITDNANWNFSFNQSIMRTGGTITSSWNSGRNETNSNMATFNPSFSSNLNFAYTQPLLRNLRIDNNRNQIRLANLDIETSDIQFKDRVTSIIANIQSSYWDLVSAIRNYDIQRRAVELAQINLRDQQRRLEVGTIPPIDVITAEASVSSRELNLISAEDSILQAQNRLRQFVSSDRTSDIWRRVIVPTDQPDFVEYRVDAETAIATALQNRPEMDTSRIAMTRLDMQNELLQNNRKWGVNLRAAFTTRGQAGPQSCRRNPLTGDCQIDPVTNAPILAVNPDMVGGVPTAYKTMFTNPGTNWSVQLNVSVPLRNRSLETQLAQNDISRRQELMRQRQREQDIQVEVLNALQSLESARRQVGAAEIARRAAELQYDGEVRRNEAGLSQNYRVLEVQQQLSNQEFQELQALIRYKQATITMQRVMYNLLDAGEFTIARGSSFNVPNLR